MRQPNFDPVRVRLAEQALAECERLGLTVFARNGTAVAARVVDRAALPAPIEWKHIVDNLGPEIAFIIDLPGSFRCFVERLNGGCRLYRPDWLARTEAAKQPRGKCLIRHMTRYDAAPGGADRSRTGRT